MKANEKENLPLNSHVAQLEKNRQEKRGIGSLSKKSFSTLPGSSEIRNPGGHGKSAIPNKEEIMGAISPSSEDFDDLFGEFPATAFSNHKTPPRSTVIEVSFLIVSC